MAADLSVARTSYSTAIQMGASPKVLLALFEAGWVESGWRNIAFGDRDSVGFLQQRPSQGWPNPMDVPTATRSFVTKAQTYERLYPQLTAGQLAQKVQVSAFPAKYDQNEAPARSLLGQVGGSTAGTQSGAGGAVPMSLGGVLGADEIADKALAGAKEILLKLGGAGLGLALISAGLLYMVRDRVAGQTKKAEKVIGKVMGGG